MNCGEIRARLSAYLDGELAAAERAEVASHLGGCVPCRRLARDLEDLGRRVKEWDPELAPESDLWPRIAARIERGRAADSDRDSAGPGARPSRPLRRWVVAAAAALAVGVLVPVAVDRLAGPRLSAAAAERRDRDRQAYEALVAAASLARAADGTLQPRRDLESLMAQSRGRLDAETVAALEAEVDRLQRAIGEIYLALEEQPDNRRLRLQLAARYRQESDLLQRLGRV